MDRVAPTVRRPRLREHNSGGAQGIALIAVLCLVGLLTVLALGAMEATRRHGQLAHRSFELAQASELADSAIRIAMLELSAPAPQRRTGSAVSSVNVRVFGQSLSVRLEREEGRIDLNAADEFLLTAAFAGNGVNENDARILAERIVDWRDPDDITGVHGAERQEYRRAGRASGPRNGAFEAVSELRQVLGAQSVTDELLDVFTVYSHSREVKQNVAATGAVKALQWADARQLGGRTWISSDRGSVGEFPEPAALAGEAVRLHACASASRVNICRAAIVRFTGNRVRPALIYAWQTRYAKDLSSVRFLNRVLEDRAAEDAS